MFRIKELKFNNFKFFYKEVTIKLDKKHVLLYGENGSGKSSIYWAIYTFLQSVFKTDPRQVQKYFVSPISNPESIKNRYAEDVEESFIEFNFEDEHNDQRIKRISNTIVNTRTDNFVKEITLASDLIDYKAIFNIYNFSNRDRVKLFSYFERNLMPFITLRNQLIKVDGTVGSKNLADWWTYLESGLDPYPGIYDLKYDSFQNLIGIFNIDFIYYLDSITETTNEYLQNKFKEDIKISFEFQNATYNDFNEHNKGRNKKTKKPEIFLNVELLDPNLREDSNKIHRAHTFLNEARLSSIALAIRMAILKEKYVASSPKILVLDDLLLSLDMGNREAVLNIVIEEYSNDYQIIFLTHDRLFYYTVLSYIKSYCANNKKATGELDNKIIENAYKETWKVLEMYESHLPDGKKIPVITEHFSHLQKALHYFKNIDSIDYNACGNNLRAALEEFFRGFIPSEFLRDGTGKPIDKNSLTLNPLIARCITYFNHIGFDIEPLNKIDRYRERALNQTSHYNPHSNYFKKELQETFELINHFQKYKTEIIVNKDDILNFTVVSDLGGIYKFKFKVLDDIRLYLEPTEHQVSFYSENDKIIYAFEEFIENGTPNTYRYITKSLTFKSFYHETINELEKNIGETCLRKSDVFNELKNADGFSLNELKKY